MSLTSSSSGWKSVVRKAKKIQNKIDNIVHNYPELPDKIGSLPVQIGKNVSVKEFNTFLDRNESTGYKFYWENKNVYIVDMASTTHEAVVSLLMRYFNVPNGGVVIAPPIVILGQPLHYDPSDNTYTLRIAANITICPHVAHTTNNIIQQHPGPPPCDVERNPHGRMFCELAISQDTALLNTKCENWMIEPYVRYVLGIKIHDKRKGSNNRSMTARLWSRQATTATMAATTGMPASTPSTNQRLTNVFVQEWDFGTLKFNSNQPTTCNIAGLTAYQVTIPVSEVFYDPDGTATYAPAIPQGAFPPTAPTNFLIDLYEIQREVLNYQD